MQNEGDVLDLAGTKEAAAIFGVRTQNFLRDWVRRPGFPAPVATLAATPVWRRSDLERYRDLILPVAWPPRRKNLRLSVSAQHWLPTIKRRLVRGFQPERIILFGSQARGDTQPDSDVDLLVVLREATDPRHLRIAMRVALHDVPVSKDIFVTTPERARRTGDLVGTILRPALREGVTIYARD
jgi:predicted nucleotidyltransferase